MIGESSHVTHGHVPQVNIQTLLLLATNNPPHLLRTQYNLAASPPRLSALQKSISNFTINMATTIPSPVTQLSLQELARSLVSPILDDHCTLFLFQALSYHYVIRKADQLQYHPPADRASRQKSTSNRRPSASSRRNKHKASQ